MRTYKRPLHEKHDDLSYALPREKGQDVCFDLCGPARDNHEGHEFQGTERNKLGGTVPGILRAQAFDHEDSSRSSVMLCSLEL